MTDPLVRYAAHGDVGTITLDSPHNRNALSRQLVGDLFTALEDAQSDESTRSVVIRSADRVFCSGADLAEAREHGMEEGTRALVDLQRRILTHPKPVIVRLAGPVRAGGLGIVASADFAICADDVTFAFTETRLALAPAVISLTVLPRLANRAAVDTFLTGRTFDAAEAAAMGLVSRSVPAAELDGAITELAGELSLAHPQGLRETKRLLNRELLRHLEDNADAMSAKSAELFGSEAAREAMAAFLSRKNQPRS